MMRLFFGQYRPAVQALGRELAIRAFRLRSASVLAHARSRQAGLDAGLRAVEERNDGLRKSWANVDVIVRQSRQDREAVVRHT